MKYSDIILGIDIGTSTLSVIAVDIRTGNILCSVSAQNMSALEQDEHDVKEQDPDIIYSQVIELIKKLCEKLKTQKSAIRGIGITGQMHGILLLGADRKALTPLITWQDGRCQRIMKNGKSYIEHIADIVDNDTFLRACGTLPAAGFGGMTLFWLKQNNLIAPNVKAVTVGDYIGIKLSNAYPSMDPTNAASLAVYDIKKHAWHKEILKSLGLPIGLFPAVGDSSEPVGEISSDVSNETGLPKDVKICRSVGDNQASFIGSVSDITKEALVNIGTGSQISCPLKSFKTYMGLDTRPLVDNRYIAVGAGICGGQAYAYLRKFITEIGINFFGMELDEAEVFEKMNELAAKATQNTSLTMNTRFMGTRLDSHIKGSIENIDINNFNIENLCRGFLHGVVNELFDFYKICSHDTQIKDIVISGNAVRKNRLLSEIISLTFKHRTKTPQHTEEAAYGAVLSAAVGLGFFKSYEEAGRTIKYNNYNV